MTAVVDGDGDEEHTAADVVVVSSVAAETDDAIFADAECWRLQMMYEVFVSAASQAAAAAAVTATAGSLRIESCSEPPAVA